jgi:hypothetical protein
MDRQQSTLQTTVAYPSLDYFLNLQIGSTHYHPRLAIAVGDGD